MKKSQHFINCFQFLIVQRTEVLHKAAVFLHQCQAAYAGKHHHRAFEPGSMGDSIPCGETATHLIRNSRLLQICQIAALYRSHDNERLAPFEAGLIVFLTFSSSDVS